MALIELNENFDFIGSNFKRLFLMGNELVHAGLIFYVCVKKNLCWTELFALCIAMSNMGGAPHRLQVWIENTVSLAFAAIKRQCL